MKKICKQSKIIILVSLILSAIFLVTGAVIALVDKGGNKKLTNNSIYLYLYSEETITNGEEEYYRFSPNSSGYYTISLSGSGYGYVQIYSSNSTDDLLKSISYGSSRLEESVYLSTRTYYIRVINNSSYYSIYMKIS